MNKYVLHYIKILNVEYVIAYTSLLKIHLSYQEFTIGSHNKHI